jgi:xylan 1,4-beta-xylosidase
MSDRRQVDPITRREAFKAMLAVASIPAMPTIAGAATPPPSASGFDGQRKADLGDGRFVNPIVAGDHPDPTILRDGDDYYITFSSFQSYPAVVIWHSRDLVNWTPIGAALQQWIGSIWAMDLVKHDGRYFIYMPAESEHGQGIFVIHADSIHGPWSDPVDLHIDGCIDPGHAVGEDGKRYLFFNGVRRIRLRDDGLATDGPLQQVYNPWRYPADWVVEMYAPEGPKIFRRNGWYYLVAAVGGTSGPPTSHMVTVARSRSIHGPWQDCPHNPVVHTQSADEPWWSRGHASVVEGPAGDWWMVYHAYENGYRTLGRQTLLEPIEWTADDWFVARGGTLATALPKPRGGKAGPAGFPLSDDFSSDRRGTQWTLFNPGADGLQRLRYEDHSLVLAAHGQSLADTSPLTCIPGDRSYLAEITLEPGEAAQAGITLYYSERMFCGIGFSRQQMFTYNNGQEHRWMRQDAPARSVRIRLVNTRNIITFFYARDDGTWTKHPWQMEVSGFHHNVFGGFLSLRLGVFCLGQGEARLRNFVYRGLGDCGADLLPAGLIPGP